MNKISKNIKIALLFLLVGLSVTSCQFEEIVPFDYPEGLIYLPLAQSGEVYVIDRLNETDLITPTPGGAYKYIVNKGENRFEIPLAVYRSGLEPGGNISINIAINNDTTNALINGGTLEDTMLLPVDKYSVVSSVAMSNGGREAPFSVIVDFAYLRAQSPQKFAFAVTISGAPNNQNLSTIVILIDTKMLIPVPNFAVEMDGADYRKAYFINNSLNAVSYSWKFGDGNTSNGKSPSHVFATDGNYQVELTTVGLFGDEVVLRKDVKIEKKQE